MPSQSPQPDAPELQEQLVAYLDGELDAESCQRIEELLASDPRVQAELQRLERAWDALDGLPRAEVGQKFTATTVEMVAISAQKEIEELLAAAPRRRRRLQLLGVAGVLAAVAGGFLAVRLIAPDPNEQLMQQLPILERLDQYRQTEDVELLRMLHQQGVFAEENGGDINSADLNSADLNADLNSGKERGNGN